MPATYEPIATTTLSSASNTITFSSIPNTYTDLRLVFIPSGMSAGSGARLRFNSDAGTNYSWTYVSGNGTAAASARATNDTEFKIGANALNPNTTTPHLYQVDIFSYAGSTFKSGLSVYSGDLNGSGSTESIVGMWRSTSAISTILIKPSNTQTFNIGTTATLYGIKAA